MSHDFSVPIVTFSVTLIRPLCDLSREVRKVSRQCLTKSNEYMKVMVISGNSEWIAGDGDC